MQDIPTKTVCTYDSSVSPGQVYLLILVLSFLGVFGFLIFYMWKKCSRAHDTIMPRRRYEIETVDTKEIRTMAYSDCMVDTYFYGYLKKIVPDNGNGGLKDRIMNYKAIQGMNDEVFPFTKMFIIITSSGYIPKLLESLDTDGRIELRQDMKPEVMSRAGVADRIYKTSIYKINFRGESKNITVVMEGAPPVVCLYETCKENLDLAKHKMEIIHMFYTKLKAKLKENLEFEDACEVIYFDNSDGKKSLADELILRWMDPPLLSA